MHTNTQSNYVSLSKELQQHLSKEHGVIAQGKCKKRLMEIKWTDIDYHVQDNADFSHKDVKIYRNTK